MAGKLADLVLSSVFVAGGCLISLLALAAREAGVDTAESLERAISLTPWNADFRERAAFLHGRNGRPIEERRHLEEAVRLEPARSSSMLDLARSAETEGDLQRAETWLLKAVTVDKQMAPAWALANFYLRRGDHDRFWPWLRKALAVSRHNASAVWQLACRVETDAAIILNELQPRQPRQIRDFAEFLRAQGDHRNAAIVIGRLADIERADLATLLWICDAHLGSNDYSGARRIWNRLRAARLIPDKPAGTLLENAAFSSKPTSSCFDWRVPANHDVVTLAERGGSLHMVFTGRQGMSITLAEQIVPVNARDMELTWTSTNEAPGVIWELLDHRSGRVLAAGTVAGNGRLRANAGDVPAVTVRLVYRRPTGLMRMEGEVSIGNVTLRPL